MKLTTRSIKLFLKSKGIEIEECDDLHINQMVHCMEQLIVLQNEVEENGPIVINEDGHRKTKVKNPAITAYKEYSTLVISWAKEFGLTPKARKELIKGVEQIKKSGFPLHRKVN